jgi:hypothetical protein
MMKTMKTNTLKIKRIIRRIFAIAVAASAAASPVAVHAAPKSPCAFVKVSYSNSVKVQKGDVFHITYATEGAKGKKTLNVDAWKNKDDLKAVSVPGGTYVISAISYSGKNKAVKDAGYACAPSFTSSADKNKGTTIFIGVGDDAKNQIISAYPSAVVVKGTASAENKTADTPDSSDTPDSADSQNEATTQNAEKTSETGSGQSADTADSVKKDAGNKASSAGIDISRKESKKKSKENKSEEKFKENVFSFFRRLAYLAVVLIVGLIVLVKLHKDKYI